MSVLTAADFLKLIDLEPFKKQVSLFSVVLN